MTVSSTTTAVSYSGNGSTTAFAVTFPFFEITVEEISALGVVTTKTEGTHYTVAGGDGSTGTVTMLVAPASGVTLRVRRTTSRLQATDYAENDAFPAETTEQALDRLHMIVQELSAQVGSSETAVYDASNELTIASGVVTITGPAHTIDTEGDASTDDLDTIRGGVPGQRLVIIAANSTRTVVAKDATGNMRLAGDCTLDHGNDTLTLMWTGAVWVELARSDNNT